MKAKRKHPARALKKSLSPSRDTLLKRMPRRPSLFWDVDPKTVDPKKHARYVIERIFEYGNDKEVRWVWQAYPRSLLRTVSLRSRALRPRSRALWKTLTHGR